MSDLHDPFLPLRAACVGDVLTPDESGYAEACGAWNLAWTQRPAAVVVARSEDDVVAAVRHAANIGLAVAVQTTGHGVTVPADQESLLIVMSALDRVEVDPVTATATVGGGATWAPVLDAAQAHGLAPLLGSTPHVGVVSYSLGGGIGWLTRHHGLAVDRIRSLRVVLGDGRVVTASPLEEPDLFWALCGTGGGSLGVVVEIVVGLVAVSEVYAGSLFYPVEDAAEVFGRYREWAAASPLELTSAFNITAFPPIEPVPEPLRGQAFVIVRGCYSGADQSTGVDLVDEWRTWRTPAIDLWGPMPFARSAEISQDPVDPLPANTSGRWVTQLDDTVLETMIDAVLSGPHPSPVLLAEARHVGGAARTTNAAVSFAARDGEFAVEIVGLLVAPGADEELDRRIRSAWDRLDDVMAALPGYLNFVEGGERVEMSWEAFPAQVRARLGEVARRYDPDRRFRYASPLGEW